VSSETMNREEKLALRQATLSGFQEPCRIARTFPEITAPDDRQRGYSAITGLSAFRSEGTSPGFLIASNGLQLSSNLTKQLGLPRIGCLPSAEAVAILLSRSSGTRLRSFELRKLNPAYALQTILP